MFHVENELGIIEKRDNVYLPNFDLEILPTFENYSHLLS